MLLVVSLNVTLPQDLVIKARMLTNVSLLNFKTVEKTKGDCISKGVNC